MSDASRPAGPTGDDLVAPAVALVGEWLDQASRTLSRRERADAERFAALTGDPASVSFTMAFADRAMRPESATVAAAQLRGVARGRLPVFLSLPDRAVLRAGSLASRVVPGIVMPLARRRLRSLVGRLVADRDDPALHDHLVDLRDRGFDVNTNLLGEYVLGEDEARRRLEATIALIHRPDVDYVSVKASSIASQLDLWAHEHTVGRVAARLRELFRAALVHHPAKFVNLDMEEYEDLALTIDAFTAVLDEPEFRGLPAGIVLQAYLPDSNEALGRLTGWALRRRDAGGAAIKVRIVKGANLAMERVDAAMHGWAQAPYATKALTDANYKRMLDTALDPASTAAVRVGVASHNLFDVAWAKLLAEHRGVSAAVEFEMLQGMAPGFARAVRQATGDMLLYTPVVGAADFDTALAYLFRRLEENSSGDNFLAHMFSLRRGTADFAAEQARFEAAVGGRWSAPTGSNRHRPRRPAEGFANCPETDPTDPAARAAVLAALAAPPDIQPPATGSAAGIDAIVGRAVAGADAWRQVPPAERRRLLRAAATELDRRRAELIAVMADESGKTVNEGDIEVCEAVDHAAYYAETSPNADGASFEPFGVVAVVPPWNFPLAIPAGGVFAALAAGNSAVLKPAPQTPRTAYALAQACWAAGIPDDALQFAGCADGPVGERLITHPDVAAIVLTGAYETAERFASLAPATPLFAETSGKNAIVVMPDADLDLAAADLVRSAFGHAGQKCSAASLAVLVGEAAFSPRFRRQLLDATRSLAVGPATDPASTVGPLIEVPTGKLRRALTAPDDGQRWLLEPRQIGERLWTPGILDGVQPGSWFHVTECFGPVLGLMSAPDLDAAIELQNAVPFGLTGGIHSLDPRTCAEWVERVQVGNAYVNRGITGAIVRRQPFGGWKRSSVGPGAKAGGPNYVAQLGRWTTTGAPSRRADPPASIVELAASFDLGPGEQRLLDAAIGSDAYWWKAEFTAEHDPSALFCEANVLRYRPLPDLTVRVAADARPLDVARVICAASRSGTPFTVSADPGFAGRVDADRHTATAFLTRLCHHPPARLRLIGGVDLPPGVLPAATYADRRAPVLDGRIELARYLREQSVSTTLHRFGNLVR